MQAGSTVDTQSMALSSCIYHSLLGHIPEFDRGIKRARFAVLRLTRVPAVLIEGGFMTNPADFRRIYDAAQRHQMAQAIVAGVKAYKNLVEQPMTAKANPIRPETASANP